MYVRGPLAINQRQYHEKHEYNVFVGTHVVYRNLHYAYLLEVGLLLILAYKETLFIVFHVGIHVDFSFMIKKRVIGPLPSSGK